MTETMDLPSIVLAALLLGLSIILAVVAFAASRRVGDGRIIGVGAAFLALGLVGVLALVNQFSPLYGSALDVDPAPLSLIVFAVALLYLSFVRGRPPAPRP